MYSLDGTLEGLKVLNLRDTYRKILEEFKDSKVISEENVY